MIRYAATSSKNIAFRLGAPPNHFSAGHALHDKGFWRQTGVGTLVSSPEQKALLVPLITCGSTAGFVPPSVYEGISSFVFRKSRSRHLFSMPSWARGTFVSCANKPARPAPPSRPARRRRTRPARGVSEFWIRQVKQLSPMPDVLPSKKL